MPCGTRVKPHLIELDESQRLQRCYVFEHFAQVMAEPSCPEGFDYVKCLNTLLRRKFLPKRLQDVECSKTLPM